MNESTPPTSVCLHCGKPIVRKVYPSGNLEDIVQMKRRKFCDQKCNGAYRQTHGANADKVDMCGMTWEEAARLSGRNVRTLVRLALKRAKDSHSPIRLDTLVLEPKHQHAEHCQVIVTINRKSRCVKYWLREFGIPRSTYNLRVQKYGMTPKEALLKDNPRSKEVREASERDRQLSVKLGGGPGMIQSRRSHRKMGRGMHDWSDEDIVTRRKQTKADTAHRIRNERRKEEMARIGVVI